MNTNTNTNTIKAIEFKAVARSNERCLVYDIRCALIDSNESLLLSLVKAWIHMVDRGVVSDAETIATARALEMVAYTGKYATVKERTDGKTALMDVITSGRVKAWLYTIRRNGYKAVDVVAEKGERPAEKAVKAPNRKTIVKIGKLSDEEKALIMALRAKKAENTTDVEKAV